MSIYAVILAGGSGKRLWPLSRERRPKQLLPLPGPDSMLAATVARITPLIPAERQFVLTGRDHVDAARAQLPGLAADHVVGEPAPLGTAPAAGLGAAIVGARDPGATMVILPADHVVTPAETFREAIADADAVASAGHLVTFGIRPTGPETGFGYIELGQRLPTGPEAYRIALFKEKPDTELAARYAADGRHLWNSGMFAWTVATFAATVRELLPHLAASMEELSAIFAARATLDEAERAVRLERIWDAVVDRTTIDYGIMERSGRSACVPARFGWSDVGSWAAVGELVGADEMGNAVMGDHVGVATTNSIVHAEAGRLVATVGIDGLVVVDTGDALLVCRRDDAQSVKQLVDRLRELGRTDVL